MPIDYPIINNYNFQADQHRFIQGDKRLVLDVVSGAIHIVDRITWDILEAVENRNGDFKLAIEDVKEMASSSGYSPEEIPEAIEEITKLISEKTLFNYDPWRDAENFVLEQMAGKTPVIKSLCLHVAHDCNLRCKYCFGATGDFGGSRKLMPVEVGKAAIDFLINHSGNRKHCEVDFFGGEPLLNFPVVQQIVEYGHKLEEKTGKMIQFTMTTNAVLLDQEIIEYLNKENIYVVLSLDGRPEVHNRMRIFADGSGSYEEILPQIKALIETRKHNEFYVIRGTYTRFNLDFSEDVLHIADQGAKQVSVEPVVASESEAYALRAVDLPKIYAEYDRLAECIQQRERKGQSFNFFHFDMNLEEGPCIYKRLKGCGAGCEYLAVTPEGDLYPCHQFVGRSKYYLGNLFDGDLNLQIMEQFRKAHMYGKQDCAVCWARFYCGGGCHANAEKFNGTIYQPYSLGCQIQKKRLEVALYHQVCKILKDM